MYDEASLYKGNLPYVVEEVDENGCVLSADSEVGVGGERRGVTGGDWKSEGEGGGGGGGKGHLLPYGATQLIAPR